MDGLNYWWKKYQLLREIKNRYQKEKKGCQYPQGLRDEYFAELMEAIK